jgi:serine/threonine-protein kinase
MGEVYRARDSKLKREVAIKVLPADVANDRERLARFQREAEVLASLNHPHIAQVYGIEDPSTGSGQTALVMELVAGEDLSQRIARGTLPIDETLSVAKQIAEALEAAHDAGIIHRDLKPANVKVRDDGTVKVLDFGLAKAALGSGIGDQGSGELANSPTITSPAMTMRGVILGTAAYMAPEQAKGKAVDKRADIWAFGCVLYEMLTGKRAFKGDDVTDIITSVMRDTPDWNALPADTPISIRVLLRRCLDKDPRKRAPHIAIARMAIDDAQMPTDQLIPGLAIKTEVTQRKGRRSGVVAAAAIVVIAVMGYGAWRLRPAAEAPAVVRFQVELEVPVHLGANYNRQLLAISPDGKRLAFGGDGLYVRSLEDAAPRVVPGTEGFGSVGLPAFSPDGQSLVFWAATDRTLKRVTLGNASVTTVTPLAEGGYGLTWSGDQIFYAYFNEGIKRVPANGGTSETIIPLKDREEYYGPQLLPDGDTLLFTVGTKGMPSWDEAAVVVESLRTKVRKTIVEQASGGAYLKSGHLIFGRGGVLYAMPFDLKTMSVKGEALAIIEGVRRAAPGTTAHMHAVASETGTLAFLPGPASVNSMVQIARFDRAGVAEPLNVPMGSYNHPRISPSGERVAVTVDDGKDAQVWLYGTSKTSSVRRLTSGGRNEKAVWSADGDRLAFQSTRENDAAIWWQQVDGREQPSRLTRPAAGTQHVPQSFSLDGRHLLYDQVTADLVTLWDLNLADGTTKQIAIAPTDAPTDASFSPDGKWFVYAIRPIRGQASVYVEPYPPTGARYQVSVQADDGHHAAWSRDGKELFFTPGPGNRFHVVPVSTFPSFSVGGVTQVPRPFINAPPSAERTYDTMPDGRILGLQVNVGQDGKPIAPRIQVVLNWFEELKQRVPLK